MPNQRAYSTRNKYTWHYNNYLERTNLQKRQHIRKIVLCLLILLGQLFSLCPCVYLCVTPSRLPLLYVHVKTVRCSQLANMPPYHFPSTWLSGPLFCFFYKVQVLVWRFCVDCFQSLKVRGLWVLRSQFDQYNTMPAQPTITYVALQREW